MACWNDILQDPPSAVSLWHQVTKKKVPKRRLSFFKNSEICEMQQKPTAGTALTYSF